MTPTEKKFILVTIYDLKKKNHDMASHNSLSEMTFHK